MVVQSGSRGKKGLNFDLNLVPFIDVLSTCICFLLMTAVFMELGTVNTKQALGDATENSQEKKTNPEAWVHLLDNGNIEIEVKKGSQTEVAARKIAARSGIPDMSRFESSFKSLKEQLPQLEVALILPSPGSKYSQVIQLMDIAKKNQVQQVGIAPL